MSQQINLYQPMLRTQKKIFSARTILELSGIFIAGLLVIYAFATYQLSGLERQVDELEARRDTAMSQLQTLAAQQQPATQSRRIQAQIREAEAERDRMQLLLRGFQDRSVGDTGGFSAHFAGLARQRVNGLWLTEILVGTRGIELAGHTEAGQLLPRYLARLGGEQAFTGTEFASLELERGDEGEPASFRVATTAAEAPSR